MCLASPYARPVFVGNFVANFVGERTVDKVSDKVSDKGTVSEEGAKHIPTVTSQAGCADGASAVPHVQRPPSPSRDLTVAATSKGGRLGARPPAAFNLFFLILAVFSFDSASGQNIVGSSSNSTSTFTANPVMLTDTDVSESFIWRSPGFTKPPISTKVAPCSQARPSSSDCRPISSPASSTCRGPTAIPISSRNAPSPSGPTRAGHGASCEAESGRCR